MACLARHHGVRVGAEAQIIEAAWRRNNRHRRRKRDVSKMWRISHRRNGVEEISKANQRRRKAKIYTAGIEEK
jgi:hypothetical protein